MDDHYTAARLHGMRTKLIQKDAYERLLKMSDKEVIAYLQSTNYKEDVNALNLTDLENLEVIDRILAKNAKRELEKLEKISSEKFKKILHYVFKQNDVWNLMLIAQALLGEADLKATLERYGRIGTLDMTRFLHVKNIRELSRLTRKYYRLQETDDFVQYMEQLQNTEQIPYMIDEQNILALLRYKIEGLVKPQFLNGGTVPKSLLNKAAQEGSIVAALNHLKATKYRELVETTLTSIDDGSLSRFEQTLHLAVLRELYKKTRTQPLGVELLLHYMAEKDIERANLRVIIKGKRLGLEESFLRQHVVIV